MIDRLPFLEKEIETKGDGIIIQKDPQPLFIIQDKLNEVINVVNNILPKLNMLEIHLAKYMDMLGGLQNQLVNLANDKDVSLEDVSDIDWSKLPDYVGRHLRMAGITTMGQLKSMKTNDILKVHGLGWKAVHCINKYLGACNARDE